MTQPFVFIRGERLLQALNEDSTYPGLYREIQRGFPNTTRRQHATGEVTIVNMKYVPMMNALQVNIECRSNMHNYTPAILFQDITFGAPHEVGSVTFHGTDGSNRSMQPVDLPQSRVKVRCNCLDFFYRFAATNYDDDSLLGPRPPLYRRVPGSNRPPANPQHVPGLCRHIIKAVDQLRRYGFVK